MAASGWYSDTDPRALKVFLSLQARMTAAQKIQAVFDLSRMLMRLQEANVRKDFPSASDREVFLRAAERRLGRELMLRVYGWNPDR